MNAQVLRAAIVALAAVASTAAFAQTSADNAPKTRQQVLAELATAQRNGELQTAGELALSPRDQRFNSSLTREQVRAETLRAARHGELLAVGDNSIDSPAVHAAPTLASAGKSRAQVKAELAEARRNGELLVAGEAGLFQRDVAGRARSAPAETAPAVAAAR